MLAPACRQTCHTGDRGLQGGGAATAAGGVAAGARAREVWPRGEREHRQVHAGALPHVKR